MRQFSIHSQRWTGCIFLSSNSDESIWQIDAKLTMPPLPCETLENSSLWKTACSSTKPIFSFIFEAHCDISSENPLGCFSSTELHGFLLTFELQSEKHHTSRYQPTHFFLVFFFNKETPLKWYLLILSYFISRGTEKYHLTNKHVLPFVWFGGICAQREKTSNKYPGPNF